MTCRWFVDDVLVNTSTMPLLRQDFKPGNASKIAVEISDELQRFHYSLQQPQKRKASSVPYLEGIITLRDLGSRSTLHALRVQDVIKPLYLSLFLKLCVFTYHPTT